MVIKWRDTFSTTNSDIDCVKENIKNNTGIAKSYGKVVYEDTNYVVLEQSNFRGIERHNDYMTIPKGCIIKGGK